MLETLIVAIAKAVPGTALLLWGSSGKWRYKNRIVNAGLIVLFGFLYYLFDFAWKPIFYIDTALIVCLLTMAISCILFRHSLGTGCMLGASSALCLILMQALVITGVSYLVEDVANYVSMPSWGNLLLELLCCLLAFPCIAAIRWLILVDGDSAFRPAQLLWLIPPICVYFCVALWQIPNFEEAYFEIEWMPLLIMIVMTISGVSAIIFPLFMIHAAKQRFELERLESDARRYYESMLEQRESDDEVRRLVHDMRNQIQFATEHPDGKARAQHLNQLDEDVSQLRFVNYTGNSTVDLVLNQKRRLALSRHIDWLVTPFDLSGFDMSSVDICSLFGNALDNAIEACERLPEVSERFVDVKISRRGTHIVFVFANSCSGLADGHYEVQDLKTSHRDKKAHGYGLINMQRIVEKNEGALSIDVEQEVFRASAALPWLPN